MYCTRERAVTRGEGKGPGMHGVASRASRAVLPYLHRKGGDERAEDEQPERERDEVAGAHAWRARVGRLVAQRGCHDKVEQVGQRDVAWVVDG